MLNDTRTRRRSRSLTLRGDDPERQFLVGEDDEDDISQVVHALPPPRPPLEEDVRSFSSDASMDSADSDLPKPHRRTPSRDRDGGSDDGHVPGAVGPGVFLQNAAARTSHADVHSLMTAETSTLHDGDGEQDEHAPPTGLAAKAGIIIGIHNIFIVIPQFIMTGLASIIFALLDPAKGPPASPATDLSNNGTAPETFSRAEGFAPSGGANSYVIIYRYVSTHRAALALTYRLCRLGGLSTAVAFVLTLRLARQLRHH